MTEDIKNYILHNFVYHSDGTIERKDRKNANGTYNKDGYLVLKVKGVRYYSHRIVWLLNTGEYPTKEIDHINRIRTDNRIENLREVDRIVNVLNRDVKPNKTTGVVGVYYDNTTKGLKSKYTFRFMGKSYRFKTLEEAVNKRNELRRTYYGNIREISECAKGIDSTEREKE